MELGARRAIGAALPRGSSPAPRQQPCPAAAGLHQPGGLDHPLGQTPRIQVWPGCLIWGAPCCGNARRGGQRSRLWGGALKHC